MIRYDGLARLPLAVETVRLEGLALDVGAAGGFRRLTTVVRLGGLGHEGLGEDVIYDAAEQDRFRAVESWPIVGTYDLDGFSRRLGELALFPAPPQQKMYLDYRRWAFESAAVDLALRQSSLGLAEVLGLSPAPVRFVASMGLGSPPSTGPILRWLDRYPGMRFKLDASSAWDDALIEELAATRAVDVIDLKGAYHGTPVDQEPDPELYRRVVRGFPEAWIEDPALTPETRRELADDFHRVTWDAPIHSVDDIRALDPAPRVLNFKPSRFGSMRALLEAYDHCEEQGIRGYGGGQFELGVGRGQIQYLASLFHADACNDVSPTSYHTRDATAEIEQSPLTPRPSTSGFRWPE